MKNLGNVANPVKNTIGQSLDIISGYQLKQNQTY